MAYRVGHRLRRRAAIKPYTEGIHRLLVHAFAQPPEQYAIKPALKARRITSSSTTQAAIPPRPKPEVVRIHAASELRSTARSFYASRASTSPKRRSFVKELIRQKHVMVVHGSGFGQKPGTQHFRIVFLPDEKTLTRPTRESQISFAKVRAAPRQEKHGALISSLWSYRLGSPESRHVERPRSGVGRANSSPRMSSLCSCS